MRTTGIIIIVVAVVAGAYAGAGIWRLYGELGEGRSAIGEIEQERSETRAQLHDANLRLRAVQESADQMPDSIRMDEMIVVMDKRDELKKSIRAFEYKDREQSRKIRRLEAKLAERRDAAKSSAGLPLAVAVVLAALGVILLRRS